MASFTDVGKSLKKTTPENPNVFLPSINKQYSFSKKSQKKHSP